MNNPTNHHFYVRHFPLTPLLVALSFAFATPLAMAEADTLEKELKVHQDLYAELDQSSYLENTNVEEIAIEKIDIKENMPAADSSAKPEQATARQEDADNQAPPSIEDPWEGFNRSIYGFNKKADKYVLKPVATAYNKITPEPVKHGVRNFFSNLKSPVILVNELLQGRPLNSAETLGRFAVNTTVGVVGIFDPASYLGLERRNEDLGQTLAVWGWDNSDYVVLPLLGPQTFRDVVGFIGDMPLSPTSYVDGGASAGLQALEITDMRVQMMPLDGILESAIDEYAMLRDAWAQGRNQEIKNQEAQAGSQPQNGSAEN